MRLPSPAPSVLLATLVLALASVPILIGHAFVSPDPAAPAPARESLSFVPNRGQADGDVRYLTRGPGHSLFFTDDGVVLALERGTRGVALDLRLNGAGPHTEVTARERTRERVSYIHASRPDPRQAGLPAYREVVYRDVWPGIDAAFTAAGGTLKYEFRVAAGADPADIRLSYEGAAAISLAGGDLRLKTGIGTLSDSRPRSFQRAGGRAVPVASRFRLSSGTVGFVLPRGHDRSRPLVIDPGLAYSTFLGGSGPDRGDFGPGIAVDRHGNAYVAGTTDSPDFPTQPGSYDTTHAGGDQFDGGDAFVTKLDPTGSEALYSTFIGGTGADLGTDVDVDEDGSAHVVGATRSPDFPTTPGAPQPTFAGGIRDAFAAKLSPDGSVLEQSTFLGGAGFEVAADVETTSDGSVFVGGETDSAGFPTTPGAHDRIINADGAGGFEDAFATRLDSHGQIVYSTLLGGEEIDRGRGLAVGPDGSAYLTGETHSHQFPTTPGALDTTDDFSVDGWVTRIAPDGSSLVYSTYLGGASTVDDPLGIAVDDQGSAYVTGRTGSTNFPVTPGAFDTTVDAGSDVFVTKVDAAGSAVIWSTFLGGDDFDVGLGIEVDSAGAPHVTGATSSTAFPTTLDAFDRTFNGGFDDAFATKLSADGARLVYSTLIGRGGPHSFGFDRAFGIDVGPDGAIHIAGFTEDSGASETEFPTTPDAYDRVYAGPSETFVAKFDVPPRSTPGCKVTGSGSIQAANGDRASFGGPVRVAASGAAAGAPTYTDHGPAQPLRLRATTVDALVCRDGSATLVGTATIDGAGTTRYRIEIADAGEPGRADTYRILLETGYDSGTQTLRTGNVQVH
ncbi:MAG: SBBP repeat-containing protein [Solirubrobacterales bacterium]